MSCCRVMKQLTGAPVSVPALALVSQDVQLRSGACPGSNKRPLCFLWKPLVEVTLVDGRRSAQDTDTVDVYMVGLGVSTSADIWYIPYVSGYARSPELVPRTCGSDTVWVDSAPDGWSGPRCQPLPAEIIPVPHLLHMPGLEPRNHLRQADLNLGI